MNQEIEYSEQYLRNACLVDQPDNHSSMRMDYLHAAERAENLMELLNIMTLIKKEYAKFNTGEYKDLQYKQQLEEAYRIASKKFNGEESSELNNQE